MAANAIINIKRYDVFSGSGCDFILFVDGVPQRQLIYNDSITSFEVTPGVRVLQLKFWAQQSIPLDAFDEDFDPGDDIDLGDRLHYSDKIEVNLEAGQKYRFTCAVKSDGILVDFFTDFEIVVEDALEGELVSQNDIEFRFWGLDYS